VREALKCIDNGQEDLCISDASLGDKGLATLAEAIETSESLRSLKLDGCCLGDRGASCLAGVVERSKSLSQISLVNNNITGAGATLLADALVKNLILKRIDLNGNPIDQDVVSSHWTPRLTVPRTGISCTATGREGINAAQSLKQLLDRDACDDFATVVRRHGESHGGDVSEDDSGNCEGTDENAAESRSCSQVSDCGFRDDSAGIAQNPEEISGEDAAELDLYIWEETDEWNVGMSAEQTETSLAEGTIEGSEAVADADGVVRAFV